MLEVGAALPTSKTMGMILVSEIGERQECDRSFQSFSQRRILNLFNQRGSPSYCREPPKKEGPTTRDRGWWMCVMTVDGSWMMENERL